MNKRLLLSRIGVVLSSVALVMGAYWLVLRPYQLHRGSTDEEVQRPMPGDELASNPTYRATRAITIDATPREIWPWLIQMGYKRAGFYGYDIIENLGSPRGITSAERIVPEDQHPQVGDELPISPAGGLVFYAIEPDQYMVWSGGPGWGGYTWALYPIDETHTRLISRARFNYTWSKPPQLALDVFTEFAEHLAIPKILQGVKGRVEGHFESMVQANMEFAIYFGAALIFVGTEVLILLRPPTRRRGLAALAAGAGWLITWYAPIPIGLAALIELVVLWGLFKAFRQATRPADHDARAGKLVHET